MSRFSNIFEYKSLTTLSEPILGKNAISLASYGVCIKILVNDSTIIKRLLDYLPPGWQPCSSSSVDEQYSLIVGKGNGEHRLYRNEETLIETTILEDIFETLDSDLRLQVGTLVRDKLFVHAGVVGWQGKAIVIPGRSFSGKTTLVAALVKAGATYYSDEYAVFDTDGLVHPYARRLSVRQESGERVKRYSPEEWGGKSGTNPVPVGLIVHTQYEKAAHWNPNVMSSGQAVLALLDNTIVARLRPKFALPILARTVSGVLNLEGKRGEAEDTALALLEQSKAWLA